MPGLFCKLCYQFVPRGETGLYRRSVNREDRQMKKYQISSIVTGLFFIIPGLIIMVLREAGPYRWFIWHLKGASAVALGLLFVLVGLACIIR